MRKARKRLYKRGRKKVAEPFQVNDALGQGSQSGIPPVSERKRVAGLFRPTESPYQSPITNHQSPITNH
jgi:hypothetical protein